MITNNYLQINMFGQM